MENPEKATSPDTTFVIKSLTPETFIEKVVLAWKAVPVTYRAITYNVVGIVLNLLAQDLLHIETNKYGLVVLQGLSALLAYLAQEIISKRASEDMINRLNESND